MSTAAFGSGISGELRSRVTPSPLCIELPFARLLSDFSGGIFIMRYSTSFCWPVTAKISTLWIAKHGLGARSSVKWRRIMLR